MRHRVVLARALSTRRYFERDSAAKAFRVTQQGHATSSNVDEERPYGLLNTAEKGVSMSQVTQQAAGRKSASEQGGAAQAKEKVEQVQQQAGEKAQQLRSQAGSKLRAELDTRSTQAGEQVSSTAEALRKVSQELRSEQNEQPARLVEQAANGADRLGRYLSQADADQILRDLQGFAQRRPRVVVIAGAAAGFLVSRFVKASSGQTNGSGSARPALPEGEGSAVVEGGSGGRPGR